MLNSTNVVDIQDEDTSQKVTKALAADVIREITNADQFPKIEIVLMQQWNDGNTKSIKRNFYFTLPGLAVAE